MELDSHASDCRLRGFDQLQSLTSCPLIKSLTSGAHDGDDDDDDDIDGQPH